MTARSPFLLLAASALVTGASAQMNDDCANAMAITTGVTAYDTTAATLSPETWNCASGGAPDLWYSYTATGDSTVTFDTCGSTYDTAMEVYDGTCGALNLIECIDDFCGLQSSISVAMNTGDTVLIRVGGWSNSIGTGTLTVTDPPPPAGSPAAWMAAANTGLMPTYSATNIDAPTTVDIGMPLGTGSVSYEFIVYGDNTNASGALFGNLGTGAGTSAGLKFEQWQDTMQYGVTAFGIADYSYPGMNTEHVDIQLVFVADINANTTELFVDGVSMGTQPFAPLFQGVQGVLMADRPGSNVDEMGRARMRCIAVYDGALSQAEMDDHRNAYFSGNLGVAYCGPAVANSTGASAEMELSGSLEVAQNNLTLKCTSMPNGSFGFFLTSQTQGLVMNPGGSEGNLCLGGAIGRYVGSGQIQNSGMNGEIELQVDLTAHPQPTGLVSVQASETWNFTTWFRDVNAMGAATSNFSNGRSATFN